MKIVTQGLSRLVLVFEDFVVKLPWINPIKLCRAAKKCKTGGSRNGKRYRFHNNFFLACIIAPFHILSANRREYKYYRKNSHERNILPITKAYFFGFILVQPKAEVLGINNIRWKKLFKKLLSFGINDVDLLTPENYGIFYGELKLLDYGNDLTQGVLDFHGFAILNEIAV